MGKSIVFLLLLATSVCGLEVVQTAPESIVIPNKITVSHSADSWVYVDPPDGATLSVNEAISDTEWVFAGSPGKYRVLELFQDRRVNSAICTITPGPSPGPTPPPGPDVTPEPPVPPTPPDSYPDTTYDIGPQCAAALTGVTEIDKEAIAIALSGIASKMKSSGYPDVQTAMGDVADVLKSKNTELGGKLSQFNSVYVDRMRAGYTAGSIRGMTGHAGALEEIALWITNRQAAVPVAAEVDSPVATKSVQPWPLGPPVKVRCELVNGVQVCRDQYGNVIK